MCLAGTGNEGMRHPSCQGYSQVVPGVTVGPVSATRPQEATWSNTHTPRHMHVFTGVHTHTHTCSPGHTHMSIHAHVCTHMQAVFPTHCIIALLCLWRTWPLCGRCHCPKQLFVDITVSLATGKLKIAILGPHGHSRCFPGKFQPREGLCSCTSRPGQFLWLALGTHSLLRNPDLES